MDAGRPEQVESQDRLRQKSIPFAEGELGVDGAEDGDKVVLEGANGTFCRIGTVFFGWNALELDLILQEGILEVLGAFVVKDVKIWGMTLMDESLVSFFPGFADTGRFAIGNGDSMDGVGVLMVQNKNVIVPTAGGHREAAGLVRVGLQVLLIVKKDDRDAMRSRFKGR